MRLCHNGRTDKCWWAVVLHLLLTAPLSCTLGGLLRKVQCPCYLLCPLGHTQWGSGQPLKHVYLMVEIPNFFAGCLVPYQLESRYIQLGVQLWEALLAIMANKPLCFLLPRFSSMYEHPLEDEQVVQSSDIPSGVLIQK